MTKLKTSLKPSRRPRPEDVRDAVSRAEEIAGKLRTKYPGRKFADSTEIVRADRDSRS